MHREIRLKTPLSDEDIGPLRSGDRAYITGTVYSARDAAHRRLLELVASGDNPPFPIAGQIIYYVGPSPAAPDRVIGAAGPTTSYRMDPYTPRLLELGLKGMIGKGKRSREVIEAMVRFKAVYFAAIGGAGALMSQSIRGARIIAYEELGPEAVRELKVENLPVIVVNDVLGNDLYTMGQSKYRIAST